MDDLISRKQAIDAVLNNEHSTDITLMGDAFGKGYIEGYKEEQNNVLQYLADLPSAQPEIIRCKDCKHHWTYKSMDRMPIERCDLEQTFYDAEHDFCSLAERREETT